MTNPTSTATKSTTPVCPRCANGGMSHQFRHIEDGACFRCGRKTGTPVALPPRRGQSRAMTRWEVIEACRVRIANLTASNNRQGLLANMQDPWNGTTFSELLRIAPDDVRARAVAALGRLGLTVAVAT